MVGLGHFLSIFATLQFPNRSLVVDAIPSVFGIIKILFSMYFNYICWCYFNAMFIGFFLLWKGTTLLCPFILVSSSFI